MEHTARGFPARTWASWRRGGPWTHGGARLPGGGGRGGPQPDLVRGTAGRRPQGALSGEGPTEVSPSGPHWAGPATKEQPGRFHLESDVGFLSPLSAGGSQGCRKAQPPPPKCPPGARTPPGPTAAGSRPQPRPPTPRPPSRCPPASGSTWPPSPGSPAGSSSACRPPSCPFSTGGRAL